MQKAGTEKLCDQDTCSQGSDRAATYPSLRAPNQCSSTAQRYSSVHEEQRTALPASPENIHRDRGRMAAQEETWEQGRPPKGVAMCAYIKGPARKHLISRGASWQQLCPCLPGPGNSLPLPPSASSSGKKNGCCTACTPGPLSLLPEP